MPCVRRVRAATVSLAGWLALYAASAHAHTAFKGANDFYAGVLHPLTAPEHVLPFVAFGLLTGQQGTKAHGPLLCFAPALMLGATISLWAPVQSYVGLVNILSAMLLGGLVAAARPLPAAVLYAIATLFGLTHGLANGEAIGPGVKPALFIPGLGLAGFIVPLYATGLSDFASRLKPNWPRIAIRAAGSWIAAIAILVLAIHARAILQG